LPVYKEEKILLVFADRIFLFFFCGEFFTAFS